MVAGILIACGVACSKSKTPAVPLGSKQYDLFNYSSGTAVNAGTFTINEQPDHSAGLTISLNSTFLVPGVTLTASIVVPDSTNGNGPIYANLNTVNGSTGQGVTKPVKGSDNLPVSYADLIAKTGYFVKVLNNTNVQAKGTIN